MSVPYRIRRVSLPRKRSSCDVKKTNQKKDSFNASHRLILGKANNKGIAHNEGRKEGKKEIGKEGMNTVFI